jgi:hypothetical protein
MTPRTPQCKVFWALLANSKDSGVSEDSKSLTLQMLGFTHTLGQSGVATLLLQHFHKKRQNTQENQKKNEKKGGSLLSNSHFYPFISSVLSWLPFLPSHFYLLVLPSLFGPPEL